jgi:hypothetical protein
LEERYVFPDLGRECGEHLKAKLGAGVFNGLNDRESFARVLTSELQNVSHDKHMRVRAMLMGGQVDGPSNPLLDRRKMLRETAADNFGFARAEIMEGNVGYLEITGFPPIVRSRPTTAAAMKFLEMTDALIIDLRRNGGGNPDAIQFICSYFFGTKTHLNSLYWREGNRTQEFWTLDSIDGPRRPNLPIFVLTSHRTFSGGEEFAYNLKTRKRATLIGETTGGGANPGEFFPLGFQIGMFVPTGRAINPVTGDNWEGKGVEPDIKSDSARALEIGYEKAKRAAAERRHEDETRDAVALDTLQQHLTEASRLLTQKNEEEARKCVTSALDEGRSAGLLDENTINDLGYDYLGQEKYDLAIEVFSYNVRSFPGSWNVYDSVGEAYMKRGARKLAIDNYRKSLSLNPQNEGARNALKSMGVNE